MSETTMGGGRTFPSGSGTAVRIGGRIAARLGARAGLAFLGPLGAGIAIAMTAYDLYELSQVYNESHKETEDEDAGECTGECDALPDNPDDLVDDGWEETTDPRSPNRRKFRNPETGEELEFDPGKPGQPGWEGRDHYHRPNPDRTSRHDHYLDGAGNPVRKGSGPSHISPGTVLRGPRRGPGGGAGV